MLNPNKTPIKEPFKKFSHSVFQTYLLLSVIFLALDALLVFALIDNASGFDNVDMEGLLIGVITFAIPSVIFLLLGALLAGPANPMKKHLKHLNETAIDNMEEEISTEEIDLDVSEHGPIFPRSYMNNSILMGDKYILYKSNGRGGQVCGLIRIPDIAWMYTEKSANAGMVAIFGVIGMLFSKGRAVAVYVESEKNPHMLQVRNEKDADELLGYLRQAASNAMIGSNVEMRKQWRKNRTQVLSAWKNRIASLQPEKV